MTTDQLNQLHELTSFRYTDADFIAILGEPTRPLKTFVDEWHGLTAKAFSKNAAWMLIRVRCEFHNKPVPPLGKIKEVEL